MNKFQKFMISTVTGDDINQLMKSDNYSIKKAKTISMAVLLPTTVWLLIGFLISYNIHNLHIGFSLVVGLLLGLIIFFVDSMLMRFSGHWILGSTRAILGVSLAILGGFLVDTVIFSKDVEAHAIEKYNKEQESMWIQKNEKENRLLEDFNSEMNGTGGSKKAGYSIISQKKEQLLKEAQVANTQFETNWKNEMKILSDRNHASRNTLIEKLGLMSISKRMELFDEIMDSNNKIFVSWILLTIAVVIFEIIPILVKLKMKKSNYELDQETHDEIMSLRRQQALSAATHHLQQSALEQSSRKLLLR